MSKFLLFFENLVLVIGTRLKRPKKKPPTVGGRKKEIYSKIVRSISGDRFSEPGVSELAIVEKSAEISDTATISAGAYIGENVKIGKRTRIYPNVTILGNTVVGNDVVIGSGSLLGGEGFGYYLEKETQLMKQIPHIGRVIIEDHVHIRANVTIDRSSTGITRIGKGTKVNSNSFIGHNVQIGSNCLIMVGSTISGSAVIGNNVVINPQAAISKHVKIGDNSEIGMNSTVIRDVRPNTRVVGSPAKEK